MDEVYAAVYDNQIESVGGSIEHVILDGIDRERFTMADVNNRDVTVWRKVGIAQITYSLEDAS